MANSQIFSIFADLTLSEEASLSGGSTVICKGGNGGAGGAGGAGKPGQPGQPGKPGKPGRSCTSGKLSKADRRQLRQDLAELKADLENLFSDW